MEKSYSGVSGGAGGRAKTLIVPKSIWAAAVQELNASREEKVPKGWQTVQEISDEVGICKSNAYNRVIIPLRKAGRIEERVFLVRNATGSLRRTIHYRVKNAV